MMPSFQYLAKRGPKETIEGVLEAENRAGVLSHLAGMGYTPVRVVEQAAASNSKERIPKTPVVVSLDGKVPLKQLDQFTRQFASLIRSQVPILRALRILKEQTSHPRLQKILDQIAEKIRQGETFSGALEKYPKVFSPLFVALIRSGEATGMLDTVMDRLALQADQEEQLRTKVRSALIYPLFVGLVGLLTAVFLLTFVLPRLMKLFKGFGSELPLPTRILLTVSGWCQQPWVWIGAALVGIGGVLLFRAQTEKIRPMIDRVVLRLPVLKTLIHRVEMSRFARAYGLLLEHGVPILQATDIAIPVVENRLIRKELGRLPAHLKGGGNLSSCLKTLSVATPFLVNTVTVGEEAGKMAEALVEVANFYEKEVERLVGTLAALLEPMMILTVGGMVGFIVMAVLLPVFELSSVVR